MSTAAGPQRVLAFGRSSTLQQAGPLSSKLAGAVAISVGATAAALAAAPDQAVHSLYVAAGVASFSDRSSLKVLADLIREHGLGPGALIITPGLCRLTRCPEAMAALRAVLGLVAAAVVDLPGLMQQGIHLVHNPVVDEATGRRGWTLTQVCISLAFACVCGAPVRFWVHNACRRAPGCKISEGH